MLCWPMSQFQQVSPDMSRLYPRNFFHFIFLVLKAACGCLKMGLGTAEEQLQCLTHASPARSAGSVDTYINNGTHTCKRYKSVHKELEWNMVRNPTVEGINHRNCQIVHVISSRSSLSLREQVARSISC